MVSHGLSLRTYFCYDDFTWLEHARSWHLGATGIFSPNFWNTFRPGTHLLWYMDYGFFADRAVGYHVISLLLYVLNAGLIYALIRRLSELSVAALIGALVFATSSGNAEVVQTSAAQGYLLAGVFLAGSLIVADKYASSGKPGMLILTFLLCLGAMLAHEQAVVVPLGLVLYAIYFARARSTKRFTAIMSIAVIALTMWGAAYKGYYSRNGQGLFGEGVPGRLSTQHVAANMGRGVPTLFIPDIHAAALRDKLSDVLPAMIRPLDTFSVGLCIVLLLGSIPAVAVGSPCVRLGTLSCLGALLVGSLSELGFAGRYLYIPMVSLGLAVGPPLAGVFSRGKSWMKWSGASALAILVLLNVTTSVTGLVYRGRYAQERYLIISQIRQVHASSTARAPIHVIGLPAKLTDVVDAGRFYHIDVLLDDGRRGPAGSLQFRYTPVGLEPVD